jgi:tetratricopeptide (TPR) repeat protein
MTAREPELTLEERVRTHCRLAALLAASGKHERAINHYEAALLLLQRHQPGERDPVNKIQYELANAYARAQRREDAIALYKEILIHSPEFGEVYVNLAGECAVKEGA